MSKHKQNAAPPENQPSTHPAPTEQQTFTPPDGVENGANNAKEAQEEKERVLKVALDIYSFDGEVGTLETSGNQQQLSHDVNRILEEGYTVSSAGSTVFYPGRSILKIKVRVL